MYCTKRKDQTWGYRPSFDLFVDHHFLLWISSEDLKYKIVGGFAAETHAISAKPVHLKFCNMWVRVQSFNVENGDGVHIHIHIIAVS